MAAASTLSWFLANLTTNTFGELTETAQTAANTGTSWTVAKTATNLDSNMVWATAGTTGFTAESTTHKPSAAPASGNAWRTLNPYTGYFHSSNWTITAAVRATTASSQTGRIRVRVYRSTNAAGTSPTEITTATQVGTTSSALSTSADVTSTVTWAPGVVQLTNEYLFFTVAWEIIGVSGSNASDVVFRTGSAGPAGTFVTSPLFSPVVYWPNNTDSDLTVSGSPRAHKQLVDVVPSAAATIQMSAVTSGTDKVVFFTNASEPSSRGVDGNYTIQVNVSAASNTANTITCQVDRVNSSGVSQAFSQIGGSLVTTTGVKTFTGTPSPSLGTWAAGDRLLVTITFSNAAGTTQTCTVQVNDSQLMVLPPFLVPYEKTGSGVSAFSASGPDADTLNRTGSGVSDFNGKGADAVTWSKTGSGVSAFSASGPKVAGPSNYRTRIRSLSPSAYYRLDETSGATALDSSGNGLVGTYVGSPTLNQAGALSNDSDAAVSLNGTSQYATVADNDVFSIGASGFSVEMWLNPTNADMVTPEDTGYVHVLGKMNYAASPDVNEWAIRVHQATNTDGYSRPISAYAFTPSYDGLGASADSPHASAALPVGSWTHVVATYTACTPTPLRASMVYNAASIPVTDASIFDASGQVVVATPAATGAFSLPADFICYAYTGRDLTAGANALTGVTIVDNEQPFTGTHTTSAKVWRADQGISIFLNGALVEGVSQTPYASHSGSRYGTFGITTANSASPVGIGHTTDSYWQGKIDEVAFYQRVLTSAEILKNYQVGTGVLVETGSGVSSFGGSGSKTVTSSGTTYSKTGSGVSDFNASGPDEFTDVDTGAGVSAFSALGGDVDTDVDTGSGVSDFNGSGASAATLNRSGSGVSDFNAQGPDAFTDVDSGAGVSDFDATGAKAATYVETGSGVSDLDASGSRATVFTKTGAGVSDFNASGTDAFADVDTGSGVSDFNGSGADVFTDVDTGSGVSDLDASGTDAVTYVESGSGVSDFDASGVRGEVFTKSGAGVSDLNGSGSEVYLAGAVTYTKTGAGVSDLDATGADAFTDADTGSGVSDFNASGSRAEEFAKTGAGVSDFNGSGASAATLNRSGSGVSDLDGAGPDAFTDADTGSGIADFNAQGGDAFTDVDSGSGVSDLDGSGQKAVSYAKTGAGVSDLNGSGSRAQDFVKTGAGVSNLDATGADAFTDADTGAGVSDFNGSGADAFAVTKTGSGVSDLNGSGASAVTYSKTGAGVSDLNGSGPKTLVANTYSSVIITDTPLLWWRLDEATPGTGTAADSSGNSRTGTYVASPSSTTGLLQTDTDAAVTFNDSTQWITSSYNPFTASSQRTFEFWVKRTATTTADAIFGSATTATPVIVRFDSAANTISFFADGSHGAVTWTGPFNIATRHYLALTYDDSTKSAELWLNGVSQGVKSLVNGYGSTGNLTVARRGSGATTDAFNGVIDEFAIYGSILSSARIVAHYNAGTNKPGSGVSDFNASGADAFTDVDTGSGVSDFNASGVDVFTLNRTGAGVSDFNASGSRAMVFTKTGSGISDLNASGTKAAEFSKTGSGISDLDASGADAFTDADTGSGVSDFNASGSETYIAGAGTTYTETGSGVSDFNASGTDTFTLTRTGSGVSDFNASGADAFTDVDTGKGVSDFNGSGSRAESLAAKTGSGVSAFVATGTRRSLGVTIPFTGTYFADLDAYIAEVGGPPIVVNLFRDWAISLINTTQLNGIAARNAIPQVTWEPWDSTGSTSDPAYALSTIVSGAHDAYIETSAAAAAAYGKPFQIRFAPEMNGSFAPWEGSVNGNTPALFVSAWQHVVGIFRTAGATNVTWVWAPNADPTGTIASYYPGDSYVDVLGIDGYNFGSGDIWQTFTEVFSASYAIIAGLNPDKPIVISETASSELGGDKAAWITSAFMSEIPTSFPRIAAVVWFDVNKEQDWRVDSSAATLAAYQGVVASTLWGGFGTRGTTYEKSGAGASNFNAAGAKAAIYAETGVAASDFSASGARRSIYTETGSGVSDLNGSGTTSAGHTTIKTGAGVSRFAASGARNSNTGKTGTANTLFSGSGAKAVEYAETGSGITDLNGSGQYAPLKIAITVVLADRLAYTVVLTDRPQAAVRLSDEAVPVFASDRALAALLSDDEATQGVFVGDR